MAILFSDNFNSGSPTGWNEAGIDCINLWGFAGTFCATCSSLSDNRKTFGSLQGSTLSVRAQVACVIDPGLDPDGVLAWAVQDFNGGAGFTNFQVVLYLRADGAFRTRWHVPPFGAEFLISTPGLYPTDGTQFGLQMLLTIGPTSTATFVVNNVVVASQSVTHAYRVNQWDDVFLYGYMRVPGGGTLADLSGLTAFDNVELDSSNAQVDWPPGTAPQLDLTRVCIGLGPEPPPPPASGPPDGCVVTFSTELTL